MMIVERRRAVDDLLACRVLIGACPQQGRCALCRDGLDAGRNGSRRKAAIGDDQGARDTKQAQDVGQLGDAAGAEARLGWEKPVATQLVCSAELPE